MEGVVLEEKTEIGHKWLQKGGVRFRKRQTMEWEIESREGG